MKKIFLTFCFLYAGDAFGSEKDTARDANLTLAAFTCSSFNSYLGESIEAERLFNLGYESGKRFYNYVVNNKLNMEVLNKEIPFIYFLIKGPNIDFNLGQLFSYTTDMAVKKISQDSNLEFVYDEELRRIKAQDLVRINNCELLK